MNPLAAPVADRARDQFCKLARRPQRLAALAPLYYPARDATRLALLAVLVEDSRDLLFGQTFEELRRRLLVARGVHSHVERRVVPEAEASLRRVEL